MFPSFSDLQFLASMQALTIPQLQMYYNYGVVNANQVQQLGFNLSDINSASKQKATNNGQNPSPVASPTKKLNSND